MAGILDSAEIEIVCKKCGRKSKKSVGWIKRNRHFTCACGCRMLLDADGLLREVGKVDRSVDTLQRDIQKLKK